MQHFEIELGIGDVVQIEDKIYTVIDVENGEVTFRVDRAEEHFEPVVSSRAAK